MSEQIAADAGAKLGQIGSAFYFDPNTLATGKELGLDGFRFYALGRGGVLGDVDAVIVQSAFGFFHGDLVAKIWNSAREIMNPREAGTAYLACAADFGRDKFADLEGLDGFCEAAEAIIANVDPAGLALYAGVAAVPRCDDLPGRAQQLATVLREYRGSVHLAAVVAEGLEMARAHFIKRPENYQMLGFTDDPSPATEAELAAHAAAEARTNVVCGAALSCLTDGQATAFMVDVNAMEAALAT